MRFRNFLCSYATKQYLYNMKKTDPLEMESKIFGLLALLAWDEPENAFELYSKWEHKHKEWSLEGELNQLKFDKVDYTEKTIREYGDTETLYALIVYYMMWYTILLNETGLVYDPKKNVLKWIDPDSADTDVKEITLPTAISDSSNLELIVRIITKSSIYNWFSQFYYRLRILIFYSIKEKVKMIISKKYRKECEEEEGRGMTSKEVVDNVISHTDEVLVRVVLDAMEGKESEDEEHSIEFWAFVRLCEKHNWLGNRVDWINRRYQ